MKTYFYKITVFAPARLLALVATRLTFVFNIGTVTTFTEAQIVELGFSATRVITGQQELVR